MSDLRYTPSPEEVEGEKGINVEAHRHAVSYEDLKPSRLEKIMGKRVARVYASPYAQVGLVGMVAFLCPGMFNCLSGIGGGGQVNADASNKASIALYSTFASVSFVAGSIHNKLGTRWTLWLGSLGYVIYVAAFLSYNFNANEGFVIFAGALLGVCASLFWSAQGALMLCYPSEGNKARAISEFWVIFNLGAVIGSAIAMGLSWNSATGAALSNGTYAAFVVLTFLGGGVAALLKDPATMIRTDGSRVVVPVNTTWAQELKGLYVVLRSDPYIILLFPLFFASNFFYTWQFNDFNGALFTLRTRSLNSLLYWLAQIFGALFLSLIADSSRLPRRTRAWCSWAIVTLVVFAVWGGSYSLQSHYTRASLKAGVPEEYPMDLTAGGPYAARAFLYIFSGFMDAVWQVNVYWLMGAISNDLGKLAMLAGFYKCLQSAGAAVAFGLDLNLQPYMTILAVTWALCAAGLLFAAPLIALRVKERTEETRLDRGRSEGEAEAEAEVEGEMEKEKEKERDLK